MLCVLFEANQIQGSNSEMLLDLFYHLSNEDANIRGSAAYKLTSTLQQLPVAENTELTGHEDLDYCLKRLLKGLQSNRDKARQGFGMALTELLNILHSRSFAIELSTILELMTVEQCKGHEYRDLLMGKLFGFAAICESTIFDKEGAISYSKVDLNSFFDALISLYHKKSYFKPLVCTIICLFVKKNPCFLVNNNTAMPFDPSLQIMMSPPSDIKYNDISIYLYGTTSIAPVLHPVYYYLIQHCPSDLIATVWHALTVFLNVDNRKRFLLLKLFHHIVNEFATNTKYMPILLDSNIYTLMNKILSSQSKSLQSITTLILSNLKQQHMDHSLPPQIALLMCNFNQLRPHASLNGLSTELKAELIQNKACTVLLLKHLVKSKQIDDFKSYYISATLSTTDVLSVLKCILECHLESVKLDGLQFVLKQLHFTQSTLVGTLLKEHKNAPASLLMALFVAIHFKWMAEEEEAAIASDIMKAIDVKTAASSDLNAYDVLMDIYIQLSSISNSVVRNILHIGLKDLCLKCSMVGIKMVCDVFDVDHMDMDNEASEEEEEELSIALSISTDTDEEDCSSSSCSSSSGSEDEENQDLQDMLQAAILASHNDDEDTDSVNSEQMFKIDKHFEEMFKMRKQEKQQTIHHQHFQSRVLDVIDVWMHCHDSFDLLIIPFMTLYKAKKQSPKNSPLGGKCDKIVSYCLKNKHNMTASPAASLNDEELEIIKEMLHAINLNGSMREYDALLIKFTYEMQGCKSIIQDKCKAYLANHSIKELSGLEVVFKDLVLNVNESNVVQILNANMVEGGVIVQLFKQTFNLEHKMGKLRIKMKPIINGLRKLKKQGLLDATMCKEIILDINNKTSDAKKEKQQIGALKGIIYSVVEATGIEKQEFPILSK